ncbi:MAG: protein-disulfide reductase DsbD family protein, partial [Verrucomicrobiales bacterium]
MRSIWRLVVLWLALGYWGPAAQGAARTHATLLLSESSAVPGSAVTGAIRLQMQPGWHTYWRSGGDFGFGTSIEWKLPTGIIAEELQWPVPFTFQMGKYLSYVYDTEVLLPFRLNISTNTPKGSVEVGGLVEWLECDDKECFPAKQTVSSKLVIADEMNLSGSAPVIQQWQQRIPRPNPAIEAKAYWETAATGETRPLIIQWKPQGPVSKPDFFADERNEYKISVTNQVVQADQNMVRLRKFVQKPDEGWPTNVTGIAVRATDANPPEGVEINAAIAEKPPEEFAEAGGNPLTNNRSIWVILGAAFLGGLILNIMPCVLPVIALKILGFVNQSREQPGRVKKLGLIYALGVWVSFMLLALFIIVIRQAGGGAAWGMQFQNPQFLVVMTVLVTLVALNLFSVFEINLGGKTMGAAAGLASKEGASGAFFNGVLTTILATPCTAPFLAGAVGYAITAPAPIILLVFSIVAVGLAAPYVILSWNPALMRYLPKPGQWMVSFKHAMGFPMAATAVWLLSLTILHYGRPGALWIGLFLVIVAFAAWIWGEFIQKGSKRQGLAIVILLLALIGGYFGILEGRLNWRNPAPVGQAGEIVNEPEGIQWQRWSPEAVAKAQAAGKPTLVDFTAEWCLNCKLNEERALEIESVRQ